MDLIAQRCARSICRRCMLALTLLCVGGIIHAQAVADDAADPPSRVARLAYISGDLSFLPAGSGDWTDVSLNRPLTTGDRLSTSRDSRAELEFGGGTLHMDGQSEVGLLDLDDHLAQVELTRGTLDLSVRALDEGQSYEIDTPTVALVIDRPGNFRLDIDGDATRVTAFEGSATVYGDNQAQRTVSAGRSYRFADSALSVVSVDDIANDAFDAWSQHRDQRYAQSSSRQYVDGDVVGYQDLDQYGNWENSNDYGEVWYPNQVTNDWAPYRDGHWAYIAPWGWSWVDDAAWGFAPYHYGRWAYTHRGWGWIPGPRGVRSIYAPALVAFVGDGRWSAGIGGRPVGWFPLGPGEVYSPWYHASHRYFTNVNLRNMRDRRGYDHRAEIDARYNHYRRGTPLPGRHDRDAPRGFTAVPGRTFVDGHRVQRDRMRIDPSQLVGLSVLPRGTGELGPVARPSARDGRSGAGHLSRSVFTRHEPPAFAFDRGRNAAPSASTVMPARERTGENRSMVERFGSRAAAAGNSYDSGTETGRQRDLLPRPPTLRSAPVRRSDERPRLGDRSVTFDRGEAQMRSNDPTTRYRSARPYEPSRDQINDYGRRTRAPLQMPASTPRFQRQPEPRMPIMREQPRPYSAPARNYQTPAPRAQSPYRQPPERAARPESAPRPSHGSAPPQRTRPDNGRMRRDG